MILLVDIGNSRTKYIYLEDLNCKKCQLVSNDLLGGSWYEKHWLKSEKIILANVSQNSLTNTIQEWAYKNDINTTIVASESERFGLRSFYRQPKQLGVDRWLALLGAMSLFRNKDILIVDAGTATTVDLLSAKGQHFGGWILPGINIMFDSVLASTTKVDANKEAMANLAFGDNTSDNVNNACWAATVGAIELAVVQAKQQSITVDLIILTGGNAKYLHTLISYQTLIEENLIFHGLELYNLT